MIPLTERVEQYLSQRDRFGTGLSEKQVRVLRKLADFATDQGAESLTIDLILSWKQEYGAASQLVWRNRLCHVRCFARWLRSLEPTTEVPPADLISAPRHRPKPYIYSRDEVRPLSSDRLAPALPAPRPPPVPNHAPLPGAPNDSKPAARSDPTAPDPAAPEDYSSPALCPAHRKIQTPHTPHASIPYDSQNSALSLSIATAPA